MQDQTTNATTRGKLTSRDLMSLERYARERATFRSRVIDHKKARTVQVGPNTTWLFEDRLTIQYQVQEMLRIEKIFEADGIRDELDTYNPLIPDGTNLKATLLIEFPDAAIRKAELAQLLGVEDRCWVRVGACARVFAHADEDLDRENDEKTSSVHFLRFELDADMRAQLAAGAALGIGIDHENYRYDVSPLPDATRNSLAQDLA
jgi:hypothetical protein